MMLAHEPHTAAAEEQLPPCKRRKLSPGDLAPCEANGRRSSLPSMPKGEVVFSMRKKYLA